MKLPDPLKHFSKDRPWVKLLALALLLAPAILYAAAHFVAAIPK